MEADRIGVILASEACYDPRAAKRVFSRMKEDAEDGSNGSKAPPEFFSTHPGYDTRLTFFISGCRMRWNGLIKVVGIRVEQFEKR